MRVTRFRPYFVQIALIAALLGAANCRPVSDGTSAHDTGLDDIALSRRRLSGAPATAQITWKSSTDPDAVTARSFQSRRTANLPSGGPRRAFNATTGARIAWGDALTQGLYPFAAYLDLDGTVCSGSLIAPRVVLTAAHCVYSEDGEWADMDAAAAYLGGVDNTKMDQYSIVRATIPSMYGNADSQYGDIALLELARPVVGVKPAALPASSADLDGVASLVAVGWGQTEDYDLPEVGRYATLTLHRRSKCERIAVDTLGVSLEEDHICFGLDKRPPTAVCHGDSGGPLIADTSNGPVIAAITSYGPDICGEKRSINMGTDVGYWRDFVENVLSIYNLRGRRAPAKRNVPKEGRCFKGSVIGGSSEAKAWQCLETCRGMVTCKAWTQDTSTRLCTLLSSVEKRVRNENCFSGYFK